MSFFPLLVLCFLASIFRHVISFPLKPPPVSELGGHAKRWEAGPMLGGMNFPDPSIILVNCIWYSFATRTVGSSIHIQIAVSKDFKSWSIVNNLDGSQRDALPHLPRWVDTASANTWAPDVSQLKDGSFLMYFSASTSKRPSKHCIGIATSEKILGPYAPKPSPLICPLLHGGAIVAAGYNDNGQRYIVYKVDGNAIGHGGFCGNTEPPIVPTPLMLQAVDQDGVTFQGSSIQLLDNKGAADRGVIEGPSLVKSGSRYILFFSAGCFGTGNYTVSYATATSITGPWNRVAQPLFTTGDYGLAAPGGMSIYKDAKHMVFHAEYGKGRALYDSVVTFQVSFRMLSRNGSQAGLDEIPAVKIEESPRYKNVGS